MYYQDKLSEDSKSVPRARSKSSRKSVSSEGNILVSSRLGFQERNCFRKTPKVFQEHVPKAPESQSLPKAIFSFHQGLAFRKEIAFGRLQKCSKSTFQKLPKVSLFRRQYSRFIKAWLSGKKLLSEDSKSVPRARSKSSRKSVSSEGNILVSSRLGFQERNCFRKTPKVFQEHVPKAPESQSLPKAIFSFHQGLAFRKEIAFGRLQKCSKSTFQKLPKVSLFRRQYSRFIKAWLSGKKLLSEDSKSVPRARSKSSRKSVSSEGNILVSSRLGFWWLSGKKLLSENSYKLGRLVHLSMTDRYQIAKRDLCNIISIKDTMLIM